MVEMTAGDYLKRIAFLIISHKNAGKVGDF